MSKTTVAVLGLGYVGLPLAILARRKGHEVVGLEKNEGKVKLINQQQSPINETDLKQQIKKYPFKASTSIKDAQDADIFIVCVPTPIESGFMPDLKPLQGAISDIAQVLTKNKLVIIESTINPGVSEEVVVPLLEKATGLKPGQDFYLAHCPERINPGDPKWNVANIPRVVGALSQKGLDKAVEFYSSIVDAEILAMGNIKEAEAVKVVENTFRDINIAFVNELAMSFSRLGINVNNVIKGAATKPFAFMPHYPGAGVGGHCIPVDPYYLIEYAKDNGFEHEFLLLARKINNHMPQFTVELVKDALNEIGSAVKNTKVALLGLSYKPNVDDDRESPSYHLRGLLKDLGANVVAYDPHLPDKSDVKTMSEALNGASAVLVATAHDEFKALDPKDLKKQGIRVVVDGRNCLDKEKFEAAGLVYRGIGV